MKKILLTLACAFGMSITAFAHQNSIVMLEHNGNITTYEPDKINDAIESAVDGDNVILSEGTFPMFNIKKKISVKGAGALTVIEGDVDVSIPGEPTLTTTLISCLKITGYLTVKSAIRGLKISQCTISSLNFTANTYNSIIDRCDVGYAKLTNTYTETVTVDENTKTYTLPYIKSLSFINSLLGSVDFGQSANPNLNTTFINCRMGFYWYLQGTIINCILYRTDQRGGYAIVRDSQVYNTYAYNIITYNGCNMSDCYTSEEHLIEYDPESLTAKGYLGNDGTIIGPLGGNTPYTLTPTVPHVTEANLKVDPKKQELNATLTVSPN